MDPVVSQTLLVALETERASLASAIARRAEIAVDLSIQDALIAHHTARVTALEGALPEEPADE